MESLNETQVSQTEHIRSYKPEDTYLKIVGKYPILYKRSKDPITKKAKHQAWKAVLAEYQQNNVQTTLESLQKKWYNIRHRDKIRMLRRDSTRVTNTHADNTLMKSSVSAITNKEDLNNFFHQNIKIESLEPAICATEQLERETTNIQKNGQTTAGNTSDLNQKIAGDNYHQVVKPIVPLIPVSSVSALVSTNDTNQSSVSLNVISTPQPTKVADTQKLQPVPILPAPCRVSDKISQNLKATANLMEAIHPNQTNLQQATQDYCNTNQQPKKQNYIDKREDPTNNHAELNLELKRTRLKIEREKVALLKSINDKLGFIINRRLLDE